jgi:hypothetical protein
VTRKNTIAVQENTLMNAGSSATNAMVGENKGEHIPIFDFHK